MPYLMTLRGCPPDLCKLNLAVAKDLSDWADQVKRVFSRTPTYGDLGLLLGELISSLPSPLGNFARSYCTTAQSLGGRELTVMVTCCPWKASQGEIVTGSEC